MPKYIYEYNNWPLFTWNQGAINSLFGEVRNLQGKVIAYLNSLGFEAKNETILNTLTLDIIKSSQIEGEKLNFDEVRSSIAKKLGINIGGLTFSNRNVDGMVEMLIDATHHYQKPLTHKRLYGWQAGLFPTGYSGIHKIEVGRYRSGEMQIVSGPMGKEKVHFEAISAQRVKSEMEIFLKWVNENPQKTAQKNGNQLQNLDPVLKSAIAHFWFIIIHPFDDGNGRIARCISDLMLARADQTFERYYSLSNQMMVERKQYYEILQKVQFSKGDITEWLIWYLNCLKNALLNTEKALEKIIYKSNFWKLYARLEINHRQRIMINKLLDGFDGKLQSSKWAKITKCSPDTALRDIKDLIEKGILKQEKQGGRSTNYELCNI